MRRTNRPGWLRLARESLSAYETGVLERLSRQISRPRDVYELLRDRAEVEEQEVFYAVLLNIRNCVIDLAEVTRGIANASLVHPREVFRRAIVAGAAGLVIVHNHPSGDPTPSPDDRAVTRQLLEAGRMLDLPLHDHVIIGAHRYFSFAEAGLL